MTTAKQTRGKPIANSRAEKNPKKPGGRKEVERGGDKRREELRRERLEKEKTPSVKFTNALYPRREDGGKGYGAERRSKPGKRKKAMAVRRQGLKRETQGRSAQKGKNKPRGAGQAGGAPATGGKKRKELVLGTVYQLGRGQRDHTTNGHSAGETLSVDERRI